MYHHEGSRYSATNLSQSLKVISIGRSTMQSGGERFSPLYYEISATLEGGSRELAERNKNTSRFVRSLSSIFFSLSPFFTVTFRWMEERKDVACQKLVTDVARLKKKKKKGLGAGNVPRTKVKYSSNVFIRDARFIEAVNVDKNLHRQRKETSLSKVLRFFLLFSFPRFFHARELQFKGRIIGSSKRKIRILVEKKRILEFLGDSLVARKK